MLDKDGLKFYRDFCAREKEGGQPPPQVPDRQEIVSLGRTLIPELEGCVQLEARGLPRPL